MDAIGIICLGVLLAGGIYSFVSLCKEGTRHDLHTCHKCKGAVFCSAIRTEGDTRYVTYRCRECGTEFTICKSIDGQTRETRSHVNIDIK